MVKLYRNSEKNNENLVFFSYSSVSLQPRDHSYYARVAQLLSLESIHILDIKNIAPLSLAARCRFVWLIL